MLAPMPGAPLGVLDPAVAADAAKVGTCLLSKCQVALARCLADGQCLQVRALFGVFGIAADWGGGGNHLQKTSSRQPRLKASRAATHPPPPKQIAPQNLVCLNLCNGAPDETACQIKCGDQYGDAAIDTFNTCAVSEQKCVPQRQDEGAFWGGAVRAGLLMWWLW